VKAAADRLKRLIAEEVCGVLKCRPEEVEFVGDRVRGPGSAGDRPGSEGKGPGSGGESTASEEGSAGETGAERPAPDGSAASRPLSWEETMEHLYSRRIYPYAFGSFQAPDVSWDEETGQGDAYFTYVYSCQAVELTVNRRSGAIKLQRIVAAHDIGRAINRAMVFGQLYGGVAQGIGMALTEKLDIDEGEIVHTDLNRYRIPRAKDIPEIKGIIIENPDPQSPTGAKGIGEPALELIAPAIANAVYNATGIRYRDLPIKVNPEDLA
jgi:CO/xanthine dehydrogenase Mo-binding subunit